MKHIITEALEILESLGIPINQLTERRREKMAKAFLSVAGMKPNMGWTDVKDSDLQHQLTSRQIITYMNTHWGETISSGSYDDIRRKDLVLPVEAFIVLNSARNPNANTNDGTRGFALSPLAAKVIRQFGKPEWKTAVSEFMQDRPSLADQLNRLRKLSRVPIRINSNTTLDFSAGKHNDLQKKIIEDFLPLFGYEAQVLYVGDTAKKNLFHDEKCLKEIKFFELAHDKLPDVVAYSEKQNWLYLIEAVTSANPITELRRIQLLRAAKQCTADLVFVTAFPDRKTYRRFSDEVAWETEVWIADAPEHLIHFNGNKFLGPHKQQ